LKRNAQTKGQRILQALTNEELSDDKPSQFLRRIQRLLGGASDNVARQLFLRKLPLPIRTGLTPFQDRPLTEQAELADQIAALKPTTTINAVSSDISNFASRLECLESPYMNSCNAATNRQMTTAIQKAVTITQHSARSLPKFLSKMSPYLPSGPVIFLHPTLLNYYKPVETSASPQISTSHCFMEIFGKHL
ncbi:hypothetical protein D917_10326, partial [Trichinella nativa]